jgi:hypothetical protein
MDNKITFSEVEKILSERFPEPDELKRFPYGQYLYSLWSREDADGKEYREHGPKVLHAMNTLLSKEPEKIIKYNNDDETKALLEDTQRLIRDYFDRFDRNGQALFRLAALYHDIGKYIIKERHPTVGWYTMEYLNPSEKESLINLLGNREDYLQLLLILIRDHDEFGVLSTGEASYPILLRAANSLGYKTEDSARVISSIMWLNLADMVGTPNLDINKEDLSKTIYDWKWFMERLEEASSEKRLEDIVIQKASMEELVVERICRLLLEASRSIPKRHAELQKESSGVPMVHQLVRKQLQTVYPTTKPREEFAFQFTHICKLDYGKRFFEKLVEYYENQKEPLDTQRLVYSVLAILRRLTSTYLAMIHAEGKTGNLIGVEMKDLTPRSAPEKTTQIIELLVQSHYPGLSWMMSDCLAWYF